MASKTFLLLALAFAVVLLISSQVSAAKEASSHESEVEDAKYGREYNRGRGGYNNGGSYNRGRGYNNGGGRGGSYNRGHGGNYCRKGCCGSGGALYSVAAGAAALLQKQLLTDKPKFTRHLDRAISLFFPYCFKLRSNSAVCRDLRMLSHFLYNLLSFT
ncbi:Glycine rich protein [Artemisia annua]|uniref:Glycine rich protein n=1 Tax=Artemisia annua TaxID=35608 RepID=A0A2U1M5W6_ARTAN|nr:Glycine rich protein [Artemisia annua]